MTDQTPPWRCSRCGSDQWVGWRAGPAHEGFTRYAQCVPCGHVQDLPKPQEDPVASPPIGPDDPGAQDECATCGHNRWRHREMDGQQVCTEYANCACGGLFVELSPATRMARVIAAGGDLAQQFATFRVHLQATMRSLHALHVAMQAAGLLSEETRPEQGAGRHRPQPEDSLAALVQHRDVDAGEYQVIPYAAGRGPIRYPHPSPLVASTWHHVDCDKTCGGTCTQGGDATQFVQDVDTATVVHAGQMADTCPTCFPRPCDTSRSECRRNQDRTPE